MKNIYIRVFNCLTFICLALSMSVAYSQKPEIVITTGHAETISYLAISPDNSLIASVSIDKNLKIWDVRSGKELRTIKKNKNNIKSMVFSDDGKYLSTLSKDGSFIIWDISNGNMTFELSVLSPTYAKQTIDVKNGKMVYCDKNYKLNLFDMQTKKNEILYDGNVISVCFHQIKNQVFVATIDRKLLLYNYVTKQIVKEYFDINYVGPGLEVSKNGKYIMSKTPIEFVVWDVQTGKIIGRKNNNKCYVRTSKFHPKTNQIVTTFTSYTTTPPETSIQFLNPVTLKLEHEIIGLGILNTTGVTAVSDDGDYVLMASLTRIIDLISCKTGAKAKTLQSHSIKINAVVSHPSEPLFYALGFDFILRAWNLKKQKIEHIFPQVRKFCLSDDGEWLGTFEYLQSIYSYGVVIRNTKTYKKITEFPVKIIACTDIEFSVDKKRVVVSSIDGKVQIWDIGEKAHINSVKDLPQGLVSFSLSGDNKIGCTIIMGQNGIKIFDVNSTGNVKELAHNYTYDTDFSIDGTKLVSSGVQKIKIWNAITWSELKEIKGHQGIIPSVKFNANADKIISCSGSNYMASEFPVKVWDAETGGLICDLIGHNSHVNSATFTYKPSIAISGGYDAMLKIWDITKCKEIVTLVAIDTEDYIIVTSDNFYTGSKGSMQGVGFRYNNKLYPFEQFDLKLNRPDIVAKRMNMVDQPLINAYKNAYLKRLKKMNFSEDMLGDDFHLPEVEIVNSSEIPSLVKNRNILLKIKAKDAKYALDRINIWINDIPVYGIKGINLRALKSREIEKNIDLILSKGNNKIQVSTLNQKGVESLKSTIFTTYGEVGGKQDLYIVAIGVSEYSDSNFNLDYAAKDANDLVMAFEEKSASFRNIHTTKILNSEATKENIIKVKEDLMKSNVDDFVVLFAAGHGLLDSNLDYYFATSDVDFSNPAVNGLPYEALENIMDGIPARKKMILIDACHSGEIDKDEVKLGAETSKKEGKVKFRGFKPVISKNTSTIGLKNSFELMKEMFADLRRGSGSTIISSASGAEFAYESEDWSNGVFTFSVLEALKSDKADIDKDGKIKISELRDYVSKNVQQLTNGKQNPTSRRENLEFDFNIW